MRAGAVVLVSAVLASCSPSDPAGKRVIRLGHIGFPDSPFDKGCKRFKELLEARFPDTVEVRIYGTAQLGEDKEMLEGLRLGTQEMHVPSSVLHSVEPLFGLFDLPFLVEDREQMARIAEGRIGEKLAARLAEHDLVLLGFWENGFRMITNNVRPIEKPEDLKGVKIRTPKDPVRIKLFRAFGANPTSMSFQEVFSALKQGVIDGQENPLSQIVPSRFYEVQRYLALSRHVYSPAYPLMSRSYFDSLPEPLRVAVKEVAREVGRYHRDLGAQEDERYLDFLRDKLAVSEIDRSRFQAAAAPVYEEFRSRFGSEILEAVESYRRVAP